MSKLSNEVKALEDERDTLRRQVSSLREGNAVMVRRDGWSRIIFIEPSIACGSMYSLSQVDAYERLPMGMSDYDMTKAQGCRRIDFRSLRKQDACGRWIFEEV